MPAGNVPLTRTICRGDFRLTGYPGSDRTTVPGPMTGAAYKPTTARRTPGSDANACRSRAGRAVLRGEIPRTSRGQTIKRARPPLGNQAPDLHLLVAGAGFEPATSGL